MKNIAKISALTFVALSIVLLVFCKKELDTRQDCDSTDSIVDETELLLEYLEKNGDPVNCESTCLVSAREVHDQLYGNQYVLDLRTKNAFDASHIPGAVQMPLNKLFFHFEETIKPMKYDRIVLACNTGQSAVYATSLLRMMGYKNVYALKWGMSSWNSQLSKKWVDHPVVSEKLEMSKSASMLTKPNDLPEITTNKSWRNEILKCRVKKLLAGGFKKVSVYADELNETSKNQIVIAYVSKKLYDRGHLKDAIHFPVRESLARESDLLKLPTDKEILIYSENGFESANAVAFLQILGYDAKTVRYGMNSFGMKTPNSINQSEIHNYTLVDFSEEVVFEEVPEARPRNQVSDVNKKSSGPKPTVKKKPKVKPKKVVPKKVQKKVEEEEEGC